MALVTMDHTMALLRHQSTVPAVRRPRMTVAPAHLSTVAIRRPVLLDALPQKTEQCSSRSDAALDSRFENALLTLTTDQNLLDVEVAAPL